jgi:molecular chaperone DnaK
MSKVIGIDLGTGNSVVSIYENGVAKVIENSEGAQTTPSVVNFSENNEVLVGITAKRKSTVEPANTVYEIKRLMGRQYTDSEVQSTIKHVPYTIIKNDNQDAAIKVKDKTYSPPEISAQILRKMKKTAEDYLNEEITKAVITVPAYFNNTQRQATIDAGKIAGLEVLRIINEPTSAALAFCQDKTFDKSQHLLVTDFGSGTLDISILDAMTVDGDLSIEVLSTSGDTHLGGTDIDNLLIEFIVNEFKKSDDIDLSQDIIALSRVKETAERAKIELSTMMQTDINLPYISADASGAKHLNMKLTRAKLESMIDVLLNKTFKCIDVALKDAKLSKSDIHEILLVGGTTRIPKFQEKLQAYFGKEPNKSVNPDLAVALGAAIQGAALSGTKKDILLLDVIPLTLSIETMGNIAIPMIEKNTTVPHSKTETFSTASDNQPAVTINVAQGEFKQFPKNKLLGRFDLSDLPPAPKGVPKIQVTFSVDNNSILTVTAKDMATNKENHIVITNSSGMSKEDIATAMADFEQHKQDDEVFAKKVSFKNKIDTSIHSFEKIKDSEKLSEEDKMTIRNGLYRLNEMSLEIDSKELQEYEKEYDDLMQSLISISAKLYDQPEQEPMEGEIVD